MLDTTHNIATPEGVELRLPLAGLAPRSLAWLIDTVIKFTAISILSVVFIFFGEFGTGMKFIVAFLLYWFYDILFEVLAHGATPGKRALGVRVMNSNGTPVGWTGSVIRNLIRFVDMLPGVFLVGCVSVLLSEKFQRLGDMAGGTIVVYKQDMATQPDIDAAETLPVKVPLSRDEQQAVVGFSERVPQISADRAEELAKITEPVFGEVDATKLRGYANWLLGGSTSP